MAGVSLCSVCVGQAGWQCPGLAYQGKECPACATTAVMWTPAVHVSPSRALTVPMPPGIGLTWSNTCARTLARDRFRALCAITGQVIDRRSGNTSCATNEIDKPPSGPQTAHPSYHGLAVTQSVDRAAEAIYTSFCYFLLFLLNVICSSSFVSRISLFLLHGYHSLVLSVSSFPLYFCPLVSPLFFFI